jgi:hypothetical protein
MTAMMECPEQEQVRIGEEFTRILCEALIDCSDVPTTLCGNCRAKIVISTMLAGAAKLFHDTGIEGDFADLARRVHTGLVASQCAHLDA